LDRLAFQPAAGDNRRAGRPEDADILARVVSLSVHAVNLLGAEDQRIGVRRDRRS
jgi:hypothetical protein